MRFHTLIISAIFVSTQFASLNAYADEYFYCRHTTEDGTGKDYSKWGKGTDFKFNQEKNRWERQSLGKSEYIYPDGRYEQIAQSKFFENRKGECDRSAQKLYEFKKRSAKVKTIIYAE